MVRIAAKRTRVLLIFVGFLTGMVACTPRSRETPTATISVTQAYQTVAARLTEVATLTAIPPTTAPYPAMTDTPAASPTPFPTSSPTRAPATLTASPTLPCDLAVAGNPVDITIPDDTELQPGQPFTKIWRIQNQGSCTWTREYNAVWFSGEMLSGPSTVALPGNVPPGEAVDIAVDMIAPRKSGTYQSNWKLRNAAGILFGIGPGGGSAFWTPIRVVALPTGTPTPQPGVTGTPPPSSTPAVFVSGESVLELGNVIDLDTLVLEVDEGADMLYWANNFGNTLLTLQGGATAGVFGETEPSLRSCRGVSLSNATILVEGLAIGTHLCYLTDQDRYGWMRLERLDTDDFNLEVSALTWETDD